MLLLSTMATHGHLNGYGSVNSACVGVAASPGWACAMHTRDERKYAQRLALQRQSLSPE